MLARALRAGIQLRDKVVVLELAPAALDDPQQLEAIASDVALGRAIGMRMVAVCEPGAGSGPLDAQRPALRLAAALDKHGERGVPLPAAGVVTAHRLPPIAVTAGAPAVIPVIRTIILIHLCTLGYVPILLLPVVDAAGEAIPVADAGVGVIAAAVAQFMGAPLLVAVGGPGTTAEAQATPPPDAAAPPPPPSGQAIRVTTSAAPGQILLDILLHAPPLAPAPPVSPGEMKGILSS